MKHLVKRIILRLTNEDYEALKTLAEESNTTISKYVRALIHDSVTDTSY